MEPFQNIMVYSREMCALPSVCSFLFLISKATVFGASCTPNTALGTAYTSVREHDGPRPPEVHGFSKERKAMKTR